MKRVGLSLTVNTIPTCVAYTLLGLDGNHVADGAESFCTPAVLATSSDPPKTCARISVLWM